QQVKNSVIVPVGSKGGFFPKQLPAQGDREAVRAAAIEAYKTFLRGLLDITDNLVDGAPTPPDSVVRRDDDDPYLVVAADKGTATFSDIANEVAAEYGFWLGDAFASGGGEGYDHKAMGITARGAWEAVKRHFRELGHDTQTEPFAVIGVGDMSGDVFGNGMLLSEQIRLLAAFDHRDIFIDPDPDPARSFAERKRLFELPRSSWGDYDTALISKGGGVFSRSLKSIPLTDEIRALTGLATPAATPFELIRALLGAKTDLLWFGGIGTYIRAAEESDDEVGDRANDAVRVSADAVRARVVGEGANLGVTQRGRIALSHGGTRINTDAVDNAGGVDCSDHEVNIKIALGAAEAAGALTREDRNTLLRDMTDEVADLVLSSNYAQTGAISVIEAKAPARLDRHQRFMRAEEAADRLDRAVEALPDDEEIAARAKAGRGLTRPELAVLVAYAKIGMQKALIDSDLPDDPYLERWLIDYFPAPMRARFAAQIKQHRLRRELIATVVADAFVNEGGPSLAIRLKEETGAAEPDAAKAFLIVRELFGLGGLGAEIDALDNKVAAEAQIAMRLRLQDALSGQCLSLLQRGDLGSVSDALERYGDGVAEVAYGVGSLLSAYSRDRLDQAAEALREAGAPSELAQSVASFEFLGGAMDVVTTAQRLERGVIETAATYFAAGARFGLDWLRISAWDVTPSDDWERIAIGRLVADLRAQQSAIAASALSNGAVGSCGGGCVDAWADAHATLVARADRVFAELRSDGELSVAKLAVASSQLRGWE
ncbi:MAG: NAD-glutamate dehydrogenase domain-containing protein, partial [Pseudomonadota bacterium]